MKADVLQRLAAINKKLTVLQPGLSESQNMSGSPPSPLNQNIVEKGATSSSVNPARVKLLRLEVRKFSGKLEEWQEFWDPFESAIHSNDSLSKVDKFSYLRGLLLEPARSAIAGFALGHRNQDCSVTTECKLCKGQHSSCLCMAKPQQASGGIKIGLEITSARATCGY